MSPTWAELGLAEGSLLFDDVTVLGKAGRAILKITLGLSSLVPINSGLCPSLGDLS